MIIIITIATIKIIIIVQTDINLIKTYMKTETLTINNILIIKEMKY